MCIDVDYLNYVIKREGTTQEAVAKACNVNRSTLRRHLQSGAVTVREMHAIIAFLKLSFEEVRRIFFAEKGAFTHFSEVHHASL